MKTEDITAEMAKTICDMYERNCSAATISRTAGLPYETVRVFLKNKYGKLRKSSNREQLKRNLVANDWKSGTTNIKVLAEKYGCSEQAIRLSLFYSNISTRKPRNDTEIVKAYKAGEPLKKISKDFSISKSTIYSIIGEERRGQVSKNHGRNVELQNAIKNVDKTQWGWQARIAEAFGISRQRVHQIYQKQERNKFNVED